MAAKATTIRLKVNGSPVVLESGKDFHPSDTLASVLRDRLGYTGLKVACDQGACGACTVLLDDRAVLSCMMLALEADGHEVVTIEGLAGNDPVIEAFAEQCEPGNGTAMQCGFCTPGFVMTAKGLLLENPDPTLAEAKQALAGNLCRCGCYPAIALATLRAAAKMNERG